MRESKIKPAGTASLNYEGKRLRIPRLIAAPRAPMWWTSASSTTRRTSSPTTPASPPPPRRESNITFIDGDKGVLQYRGYPIADLAEHSNFLETCYLLLNGELPNKGQMEKFELHHHPPHHGA